jgi:hypothetical protein
VDNAKSYPQARNFAWPGPAAAPDAGRIRQTLTAGDDDSQTSPTRDADLVVRVDSLATLLAVISHLLGFIPQASLVVIGTGLPRDRLRVTLRHDLPDPPQPGLVADLAAHAVGVLHAQRLTAAVAVGYGPESLVTPAADDVREAARQAGIDVREFLRVQEGATGPTCAATRRAARPPERRSTPPPRKPIPPRPPPWPASAARC